MSARPPRRSRYPWFQRYEESEEEPAAREGSDDAAVQYMKLGGIFVGVLLAVLVIIAIVVSLVKGDAPKENPDIAINSDIATQPAPCKRNLSSRFPPSAIRI